MATQIAARSAKAKVLPPSSPFGELLRRSRFAAYDPEIRQAYGAPPSYIYRGNWGLKRPIANKKRNSYVVLKKFEEHAQYIEWDNAEEQVRFLKRVEELNIAPKLVDHTNWYVSLGPLATTYASGLDSDFCPGEDASFGRQKSSAVVEEDSTQSEQEMEIVKEERVSLDDIEATRGQGNYGLKARPTPAEENAKGQTFLQPNIMAMPPRIFKQYLKKLREMRPEFLAFLRNELCLNADKDAVNPDTISDEELVMQFADKLHRNSTTYHMRFLGFKSEAEYMSSVEKEADVKNKGKAPAKAEQMQPNASQPIRPQPHKLGGLMYAMPTTKETYYSTQPQPGYILQLNGDSRINRASSDYMAAFAGLSAQLREPGTSPTPVFDLDSGIDPTAAPSAERPMRLLELKLERLPDVVGRHASSVPVRKVQVRADVAVPGGAKENWRDNPHKPGSREYASQMPENARSPVPVSSVHQRASGMAGVAASGIPSHFATSPWFGFGRGGRLYDSGAGASKVATGTFGRPAPAPQGEAGAANAPNANISKQDAVTLDLLKGMSHARAAGVKRNQINTSWPTFNSALDAQNSDKKGSEDGEGDGEGEKSS